MKKRKRKPVRQRVRVRLFEKVEPTPETKAKLVDDPFQKLVEAGNIDAAGERAAEEIRRVFMAICRDVMAKISRPAPMAAGKVDMSDDLAEAHAERYLPWVRETGRNTVSATLDLLLEGRKPDEFSEIAICQALQNYAKRF